MSLRILLLFLFLGQLTTAQNQSATATASPLNASVGDIITLEFTLTNLTEENFSLPNIENFQIISGPSRRSETRIFNQAVNGYTTYTYQLIAEKEGVFEIPAASFKTSNGNIYTNSLTIEIRASDDELNKNKDFILKAELEKDTFSIGEQIILNYNLYYTQNINSIRVISEDDYKDLSTYNMKSFRRNAVQELIDGRPYTKSTIRKIAIFPVTEEIVQIEPMIINADIVVKGERRRSLFGYTNVTKPTILKSNSISYVVKRNDQDLLVGNFWVKLNCSETTTDTDKGVKVKVTLDGNGDPTQMVKPDFESNKKISVFEADLIEDYSRESDNYLRTRKQWEFLIIPEDTGLVELKVTYPFYDTSGQVRIAESDECLIYVSSGTYFNTDTASVAQTFSQGDKRQLSIPWWLYLAFGLIILGIITHLILPKDVKDVVGEKNTDQILKKADTYKEILPLINSMKTTDPPYENVKNSMTVLKKMAIAKTSLQSSKVYSKQAMYEALKKELSETEADKWLMIFNTVESKIYTRNYKNSEAIVRDVNSLYKSWS